MPIFDVKIQLEFQKGVVRLFVLSIYEDNWKKKLDMANFIT